MTREDAVKLATAIAKANGHDDAEAWAQKVGEAFDALDASAPEAPPADEGGGA